MNKLVAVRRFGVAVLVAGAAVFASSVASADQHNLTFRSAPTMHSSAMRAPAMRTAPVMHSQPRLATWNPGFRGMSAPQHPIVLHIRNIRGGTSTLKMGATSPSGGAAAAAASGAHADAR